MARGSSQGDAGGAGDRVCRLQKGGQQRRAVKLFKAHDTLCTSLMFTMLELSQPQNPFQQMFDGRCDSQAVRVAKHRMWDVVLSADSPDNKSSKFQGDEPAPHRDRWCGRKEDVGPATGRRSRFLCVCVREIADSSKVQPLHLKFHVNGVSCHVFAMLPLV